MKAKVLAPINHLGRNYAAGALIEVDASTAHQLVVAGVIAIEPDAPPPVAKPAAAAPAKPYVPKGRES
jgi:hypothetical protein